MPNKAIVVLIGNNGTIISKHTGNAVITEFVDKLTDENKPNLVNFFNNSKGYKIYIMLDTIDQTYKKKTYPMMRRFDLDRIAKRDLSSDGDKEGLKNYIILKNHNPSSDSKKKSLLKKVDSNKSECLFITSSKSENIANWLNFIYELPNRLIGIYMLPVECFNVFVQILKFSNQLAMPSVLKLKENNIFCLVIQTRTGGARQIVFSNSSIVFTRVVNYNFDEINFVEKYSQDVYSTFEYLKRLYIDLSIQEFEVINILPEKASSEIMRSKNIELNIKNYTVQNTIDLLKIKYLKMEDDYFDLLINDIFVKSKKILKFSNQRIKTAENFYFILKSSYFLNFILVASLIFIVAMVYIVNESISEKIEKAQDQKVIVLNELGKVKKNSMQGTYQEGDKEINIERVGDMGRVEQGLGKFDHDFIKTYSLMTFSKDFDIKFKSFNYGLISFNPYDSVNKNADKQLTLYGTLYNKDGDIENLFTEFDKFVVQMKKSLPDYDIKYNELPRSIDFNQKYYDFPVEFRIISKKNEN
jgi:phosphatidylglycerophosphatase A